MLKLKKQFTGIYLFLGICLTSFATCTAGDIMQFETRVTGKTMVCGAVTGICIAATIYAFLLARENPEELAQIKKLPLDEQKLQLQKYKNKKKFIKILAHLLVSGSLASAFVTLCSSQYGLFKPEQVAMFYFTMNEYFLCPVGKPRDWWTGDDTYELRKYTGKGEMPSSSNPPSECVRINKGFRYQMRALREELEKQSKE